MRAYGAGGGADAWRPAADEAGVWRAPRRRPTRERASSGLRIPPGRWPAYSVVVVRLGVGVGWSPRAPRARARHHCGLRLREGKVEWWMRARTATVGKWSVERGRFVAWLEDEHATRCAAGASPIARGVWCAPARQRRPRLRRSCPRSAKGAIGRLALVLLCTPSNRFGRRGAGTTAKLSS